MTTASGGLLARLVAIGQAERRDAKKKHFDAQFRNTIRALRTLDKSLRQAPMERTGDPDYPVSCAGLLWGMNSSLVYFAGTDAVGPLPVRCQWTDGREVLAVKGKDHRYWTVDSLADLARLMEEGVVEEVEEA